MLRLASRLRPHAPLIGAAVVTALFLIEGLLPGRAFFYRDLGTQFFPVLAEARQGADGAADPLPFWTHASTNGRPLLANPGFALLSPFSLLWLAFSHATAFDLFLVAHALLAAAGMASLARVLGLSPAAAFAAGCAAGLGGGVVSAHNLWWALVAFGWAPWVIRAALRAIEEARPARLAVLALMLALQANGGMPEIVVCTLLVGALLALARGKGPPARRAARTALTFGACGIWAILMASPQLVPGALHARTTLRGWGFTAEGILYNSLDPRALPGLALPGWGGHPMRRFEPGGFPGAAWTETGTPYVLSHYCGLVACALALAAFGAWLLRRLPAERRSLVPALGIAAACGVVVALGSHVPPLAGIVEAMAPLPLRFTVKALFATFLAVPLLAAIGADAVAEGAARMLPASRAGLLLALAVVIDLQAAHRGFVPTVSLDDYEAPPLALHLRARAEALGVPDGQWFAHHERFPTGEWGPPAGGIEPTDLAMHLWQRRMLMPPLGMPWGIRHSHDRLGDMLEDVSMVESARRAYAAPRPEWARLLGDAGVLFVVSPSPDLEERTDGLLRRDAGIGAEFGVPEGSGFLYRNAAFRPRFELTGEGASRARIESWSDDHRGMTVRVSSEAGATLLVREALGDLATWRAHAGDGRELEIRRADLCWAEIDVPAGQSEIRLDHVPPGWNLSLALSALALGAAAICFLPRFRS